MDNVTHVTLLVKPFLGSNRPWERRTTVWVTDFAGRREAPPPSKVVSCRTDGHRVTERFTPRDLAARTLSRYLLRRPLQSRSMRHVTIQRAGEFRLVVRVDARIVLPA